MNLINNIIMDRNEAIEIVRMCCPKIANSKCDFETAMRVLVPELKESEDERIRKAILELVKQSSHILNPMNQKSMIAWLEKQGKEEFNEASYKTGIKRVLDNPESYGLEKQGEQKSTDNVKPKYKVGDWIVCCDYEPERIIGIRINVYEMSNEGGA